MRRLLSVLTVVVGLFSIQFTNASVAAASGSLDPTFATEGVAFLRQTAYDVAIQSDGKIVVTGSARYGFALTRYNRNGTLDRSFSGDGLVRTPFAHGARAMAVVVQPDGRIVAGGTAETRDWDDAFAFARYLPDGTLDRSFSGDGKVMATHIGSVAVEEISDIALGPKGTIVASAYVSHGGPYLVGVVRLTRRGAPDTTFSGDGVAVTPFGKKRGFADSVAIQPDGTIVAAGSVWHGDAGRFAIARYLPDGTPDDSFHGDGKRTITFGGSWSIARSLALQNDGKIVITGAVHQGPRHAYGRLSIALARCNADGTLDATFAGGGKQRTSGVGNLRAASVAMQSDGRIVVGGEATPTVDEYPTNFAIARYTAFGALDTTFAGDGIRVTSFRLDDWIEAIALQPNGNIVAVGASQGGPPRGYAVARYVV